MVGIGRKIKEKYYLGLKKVQESLKEEKYYLGLEKGKFKEEKDNERIRQVKKSQIIKKEMLERN